jgi:phenylacetate-CoA ligase
MSALDVAAIRRTAPLVDERGMLAIERIARHPSAPRWNRVAGDRLERDDLLAVDSFRAALARGRARFGREPPAWVRAWARERAPWVPSFRARVGDGAVVDRAWARVATSSREDLAVRPETMVPDDAPLERMIVYRTAGTTGHALLVPHDRRAAACYLPLLEVALARWGVERPPGPGDVALLVGAQAHTVTYATALAAWGQAGFAKLNLAPDQWPAADAPARFFRDLAPALLTGDPLSFAELLARGVLVAPRALVTTAVAMSDVLRARLEARFRAPVIDWYSLTETGPLGYACPRRDGAYHVVAHDVFLEALDADGAPVAAGERGEIAVTGGRNPFLPLLRYRTGDWGALRFEPCACGDPMPRIVRLEGRAPVVLRASSGARVNPVDVSGALRAHPIVQHELAQRADLSCDLTLRPMPGEPLDLGAVARDLAALLGALPLRVRLDPALGDRTGKAMPYRSELPFEE